MLITVGEYEYLYSDSERVADKAKAVGVDVTFVEGKGMIHVWQIFYQYVPESQKSIEHIGAFIQSKTQRFVSTAGKKSITQKVA